jgi:lipopolysaccharide biosynthesis glycosyltransferase
MQEFNITFSINRPYLLFACVTLYSLLKNNKNAFFNVYILHNNCLDNNYINVICNQYPLNEFNNFKIILIDISTYMELNQLKEIKNWSIDIYSKIFLPIVLPSVDKIMHLDADVIVLKDITELFNINMDNALYCCDNSSEKENEYAFNIGVSLHNLKLAKDLNTVDALSKYLSTHSNVTEEYAINELYKEKIIFYPKSYIFTTNTYNNFKENHDLVKIIHYVFSKPWRLERSNANLKKTRVKEYFPYLEVFIKNKYKLYFRILILCFLPIFPKINSLQRRMQNSVEKKFKAKKIFATSSFLTNIIYKFAIINKE